MSCIVCKNLERAFEIKLREYEEARSAADYQVNRKFAAYRNVEMERARNELEEHRLVCASAIPVSAFLPVATLPCLTQRETLRNDPRLTINRAA